MTTVYPLNIQLGPLNITGYGIMMMVGFLVGGWLMDLELRRRGLRAEYAADMIVAAVVGGIVGAKLWYVALFPEANALFSRGGLVWYGGFVGGFLAVVLQSWRLKVPIRWTAELAVPALAAGYSLGRIGCFLVGDDYGRPTEVAWAVKFPQGMPPSTAAELATGFHIPIPAGIDPATVMAVHPTQLYETAIMFVAFMCLWSWRKHAHGTGWLFGVYLLFAGCERFVIEIFRAKDDRFFGPFTIAQAVSVTLVMIGIAIVAKTRGGRALAPGEYLNSTP